MKQRLTIIVPVTKMAGKLQNMQKWLAEVDYNFCNIVIVHDKADDFTSIELELILTPYGNTYTFIEGEFGSPGAARNAGLKIVSTDWVCFWDSDDLPKPHVAKSIISRADQSTSNVVVANFAIYDSAIEMLQSSVPILDSCWNALMSSFLKNPGLWRFFFKADLLEEIRFPEISMGEDLIFLYEVLSSEIDLMTVSDIVYIYFKGVEGQLTSRPEMLRDLREALLIVSSLKSRLREKSFGVHLVVKLSGTLIKSGSIDLKFVGMFYLIKTYIRNPMKVSSAISLLTKF